MLREERELLADLMRVSNQAPDFALEFVGGDMPVEIEETYAHRLVDVAELLLNHAKARRRLVINAQPTPPALGPGSAQALEHSQ